MSAIVPGRTRNVAAGVALEVVTASSRPGLAATVRCCSKITLQSVALAGCSQSRRTKSVARDVVGAMPFLLLEWSSSRGRRSHVVTVIR